MRYDQNLALKLPEPSILDAYLEIWRPKICFEMKQSRYIIKTAQTAEEFEDTIRLRSEVFLKEFAGKTDEDRLDIEDRDSEADFLIIKDAVSSEIYASYRLISSNFSDNFYSKSEFSIEEFLGSEGKKLELSRACVRADKRSSGIFLHLLWRGLIEYIRLSGSRYLFGCSSIQYLKLPELVNVYQSLAKLDAISKDYSVRPLPDYSILELDGLMNRSMKSEGKPIDELPLPPLLLGYIKAGAKVYGAPAYDQDFGCLDLFTVLDFENLNALFLKRYLSPN
ncbi:MAG: GNAT family N-acetyltransferase [Proteobacteria bacterium]|nr:MAG: GNAT family N-acetyltransferase [Pseudomonadota bacterium]